MRTMYPDQLDYAECVGFGKKLDYIIRINAGRGVESFGALQSRIQVTAHLNIFSMSTTTLFTMDNKSLKS